MAIDHIAIYVKLGIDCAEGETKVPESEHIAIANRIYAQLREQTTSDDYEGCIAGGLLRPDLMVEAVSANESRSHLALQKISESLDRGQIAGVIALLNRVPSTLLMEYLNGELN